MTNLVYNTDMKRNNNTNERRNKMVHLDEIVASKMKNGLTAESDQIQDMGRVLTEMGKSYIERNYHLNVDADFIPDVLAYYKQIANNPKLQQLTIQALLESKD